MKLRVADELVEKTLNGEKLPIARLISMVEKGDEYGQQCNVPYNGWSSYEIKSSR